MSEKTGGGMEGPEWDEIRHHLEAREFDEAAAELTRLLPSIREAEDRATCLQLVASSYWLRTAEERLRGKQASANDYRAKVKQTYLAALEELPEHVGLRTSMGMFIMMDEGDPRGSLPYLEPVRGRDVAAADEQKRLALRGVALALLGEKDEALETLLRAYGGAFPEAIKEPETGPLSILLQRGVKLPKAGVATMIRELKRYAAAEDLGLEELREKLGE